MYKIMTWFEITTFYLEVAHPALLYLAKLSLDQGVIVNNVKILCTNNRISFDENNLLVNSSYFFNLLENITDNLLGTVTIHCQVSTKLVQLQGYGHPHHFCTSFSIQHGRLDTKCAISFCSHCRRRFLSSSTTTSILDIKGVWKYRLSGLCCRSCSTVF